MSDAPQPKRQNETASVQFKTLEEQSQDITNSMRKLISSYTHRGRHEDASSMCEELLKHRGLSLPEGHPEMIEIIEIYARSLAMQHRYSEAAQNQVKVLAWHKVSKHDEKTHLGHISAKGDFALYLSGIQRFSAAAKLQEEVVHLYRRELGNCQRLAISINNLARSYIHLGREAEATMLLEEALGIMVDLPDDHPDVVRAKRCLGLAFRKLDRHEQAVPNLEEALNGLTAHLVNDDPSVTYVMRKLGDSLVRTERHKEAHDVYKELIAIQRPIYTSSEECDEEEDGKKVERDPDPPVMTAELASSLSSIAMTYMAQDDLKAAFAHAQEALQMWRVSIQGTHPLALLNVIRLHDIMRAQGNHEEALKALPEAVESFRKAVTDFHGDVPYALNALSQAYEAGGQLPKAIQCQEQILKIRRAKLPCTHKSITKTVKELARLYAASGQEEESKNFLNSLLEDEGARLAALVKDLKSKERARQFAAAQAFRRVMSQEEAPFDTVLQVGAVPPLVALLDKKNDPALQFEATWAVTNIASSDSAYTKAVVDAGAINVCSTLVKLMGSPIIKVREQAVWALGNVAGDGVPARDMVIATGLITLLLPLCESEEKAHQRNAVRTLSNLLHGDPQPPLETMRPTFNPLCRLVHVKDSDVLSNTLYSLSCIVDDPNPQNTGIQAVLECLVANDSVDQLVKLMLHKSRNVKTLALRTVANIVTGNHEQTQMMVDADVLSRLFVLLNTRDIIIVRDACFAVSNISAGTRQQIQAVIDAHLIQALLMVIRLSEDKETQKYAAQGICNATYSGTDMQIQYLITHGSIGVLNKLLLSHEPPLLTHILSAFLNMLRVGQSQAKGGRPNGVRTILDKDGAVGNIRALCRHRAAKVKQLALRILGGYFSQQPPPPVRPTEAPLTPQDLLLKMTQLTIEAAKREGKAVCWNPLCKHREAKELKFKRCSRCQEAQYCSVQCQRSHWKFHKPKCVPCKPKPKQEVEPKKTAAAEEPPPQKTVSRTRKKSKKRKKRKKGRR